MTLFLLSSLQKPTQRQTPSILPEISSTSFLENISESLKILDQEPTHAYQSFISFFNHARVRQLPVETLQKVFEHFDQLKKHPSFQTPQFLPHLKKLYELMLTLLKDRQDCLDQQLIYICDFGTFEWKSSPSPALGAAPAMLYYGKAFRLACAASKDLKPIYEASTLLFASFIKDSILERVKDHGNDAAYLLSLWDQIDRLRPYLAGDAGQECIRSLCCTVERNIEEVVKASIKKRALDHSNDGAYLLSLLDEIDQLKPYLAEEAGQECIRFLFRTIETVVNRAHHIYNSLTLDQLNTRISQGKLFRYVDSTTPYSATYPLERYRKALATFRTSFTKDFTVLSSTPYTAAQVRQFQKNQAEKFHQFLQETFFQEAFLFLGPPPCDYDYRAMGSLAREEITPFSDLESIILIKEEKHRKYFQTLAQCLELQISSLGETASVLEYLPDVKGFCIDSGANPGVFIEPDRLIRLPGPMADHHYLGPEEVSQSFDPEDKGSLSSTLFHTASIHSSESPELFTTYHTKMQEILDSCPSNFPAKQTIRQKRVHQQLEKKLKTYRTCCKNRLEDQIDLKENFISLLCYLLHDLGLYFNISSRNSIDTIDELIHVGIFTKESGNLLKESVATLYMMRVQLHLKHQEGKEVLLFKPESPFPQKDKVGLEKIDCLVLKPLYSRLAAVFDKSLDFQHVFTQLDLVSVAFADAFNNLSSQSIPSFKRLIFHLVSHCAQEKAPLGTHESYFKQLSKIPEAEPLRQFYLEVLGASSAKEFTHPLGMIPNTSGLRRAFLRQSEQLFLSLEAITAPELHPAPLPQVKVSYTSMRGERYLRPEIIKQILDEKGNIRPSYKSAHAVSPAVFGLHQLHFKQKPTQPLMEWAIHNLFFRIAGHLTPPTELVRFDVKIGTQEKMYPVLVSQTIQGKTLKEALNKSDLFPREPLTWMLLCSILTRPGDGRLSNYVLDENLKLYCIDNDISFVEPVIKEWTGRTVNFCSALFCLLPETQRLSRKVLEEFCSLNADLILNAWIEDVIAKEKAYLELFSDAKERDRLYNEDPKNRFKATILFQEGALATLNLQFYHLQDQIRTSLDKGKEVNALTLLNHLIHLRDQGITNLIGPYVYHQYKKALAIPDLEKRLQEATSRKQEPSLTCIQSDYACYGKTPTLEEVEKRQLYSPSKAREELFSVLLSRVADHVKIGKIQTKKVLEANFKHTAEPSRQKWILDALFAEINRSKEKPLSVVLQNCSAVNSKTLEPFLHEKLEVLDLRFCENIQGKDIVTIQRLCPGLQELYLSGCSQITYFAGGLVTSTPLEFVKLNTLYIEQCNHLNEIILTAPFLKRFSAKNNSELIRAHISSNSTNQFSEFSVPKIEDFENCPKLFRSHIKLRSFKLKNASKELQNDKDVVLATILLNHIGLQFASKALQGDIGVVLAAVKRNGWELQFASKDLQDDREIVLAAVRERGSALRFASKELQNNLEVLEAREGERIIEITKTILGIAYQDSISHPYGRVLENASEYLKNDKDVVLSVVQRDGFELQYASEELQNDKEVVLAAVRQDSRALQFAIDKFRNDEDVVLAAVIKDGYQFTLASKQLRNNKDFVLAAVRQNGLILEWVDFVHGADLKRFKNDKDVVLAAVTQNTGAFRYASEDLKKDKDVLAAAQKNLT